MPIDQFDTMLPLTVPSLHSQMIVDPVLGMQHAKVDPAYIISGPSTTQVLLGIEWSLLSWTLSNSVAAFCRAL